MGPGYVEIGIGANLAVHDDAPLHGAEGDVRRQARAALNAFFHPLTGGPDSTGWPFGQTVHASEIYAVLEKVTSVNYVEDVQLVSSPERLLKQGDEVIGIKLDAHELVKLLPASDAAKLVAYDAYGQTYAEALGAT
ncbi:MAG: hypothetical protein HC853_06180 [Anaerolineae bacterium]|nr:hypothetical protein [Anaerolineae bacterium]